MEENSKSERFREKKCPKLLRIMRISLLLLLLSTLTLFADDVYSQRKEISVRLRNTSLREAFSEIEKSSDYVFLVTDDAATELNRRVNIVAENESINEILNILLHNTHLEYRVVERQISVFLNKKQLLPVEVVEQQQQPKGITVKGRVTDKYKEALPGITLVIKGTTRGVATDINGRYTLENVPPNAVLIFSCVGMKNENIEVKGRTSIDVVLQDDASALQEVVVTGYQTLSKERATGSFAQVKKDKLEITQLGSVSVTQGLAQLLPGVYSGEDNLNIRGVSSIYADKTPLYVVDDIPVNNINSINPKDIESVTVLKDAAAASIWGVRASNGVVVITTKMYADGEDGKTNVDFSANTVISEKPNFDYFQRPTTAEYIDFEKEIIAKGAEWFNPKIADRAGYTKIQELYYKKYKGEMNDAQIADAIALLSKKNYLNDRDLFFRKRMQQQINISISGKSKKNRYYASAGYTHDIASLIGNSSQLMILNLRNDFQLSSRVKLSLGISTSFSKTASNGITPERFNQLAPYETTFDEKGNYSPIYTAIPEHVKKEYYKKGYMDWSYNLKQELDNRDITANNKTVRIFSGIDYEPIDGLTLSSKFIYESDNSHSRNYQNTNLYDVRNLINTWTVFDAKKKEYVHKFPKGPLLDLSKQIFSSWTLRNMASYNKVFNEVNSLNAVIGTELRSDGSTSNQERYYNYNDRLLSTNNFDAYSLSKDTENYRGENESYTWSPRFQEIKNRFFSLFANTSYGYLGKYTVSGSFRIDQSDLFGTDPKYRYDPTWSVGLSWRASEEDFLAGSDVVNHLLLRLTYGINGNISKSSPFLKALYEKNFDTQEDMLSIVSPANPQLRKEKTAVTNVGVDFSLFNSRLSGSVDVYRKFSSDLLGIYKLDPTAGFNDATMNTAQISNKGIDISINGNILTGNFGWDMTLNFGYNVNKVVKVENPRDAAEFYVHDKNPIKGKPLAYLYSYRWAGLSDKGEPRVYNAKNEIVSWEESMNDVSALKYVGTTTPPIYGSVISTFTYKNFSLTPIFSYQLGHVMRLPHPELDLSGINTGLAKRWRKSGDEAKTNIPRIFDSAYMDEKWNNYARYNDSWDGSASFVRLESITLSYDFNHLIRQNFLSSARFILQATNLGLWTANKNGVDPESYDLKFGSFSNIPPLKSFTIGVNLGF